MAITIPILTDFNASGINKATKSFQQLETNGQRAAFAVRKAAVPAGIALVALAAGAIDAANAAITDQAAQDQLTRSLDKTTTASDGAIKSVDTWITSLSSAVAVADDELATEENRAPAAALLRAHTRHACPGHRRPCQSAGRAKDCTRYLSRDWEAARHCK